MKLINFYSAVTILVAIFIAWGTAYDIVLRKRVAKKMDIKKYSKDVNSDSSGLNCTTYDLTRAITDKKSTCVGIGIPSGVNNNNSDENLAMENNIVDDDKLCKEIFDFLRCSSVQKVEYVFHVQTSQIFEEIICKFNKFIYPLSSARRTSSLFFRRN